MTDHPARVALEAFEAALHDAVRRYRRMTPDVRLRAALDLAEGFDGDVLLEAALLALAEEGEINAAALLVVFDDDLPQCREITIDAMSAVARRSADVQEGLLLEGLAALLEEVLEEEVASGQAMRTVDPTSGRALYSKKARRDD